MTGRRIVFVCVPLILLIHLLAYRIVGARKRKCEELAIPMCEDLGYNTTYMPNRFHHDTQKEAALEVHTFWPLVEIKCSPMLKFFLCSLYAPICDKVYGKELLPCRSVCEQAKAGCVKLMKEYGFAWPKKMECHLWPKKTPQTLCMSKPNSEPNPTASSWPTDNAGSKTTSDSTKKGTDSVVVGATKPTKKGSEIDKGTSQHPFLSTRQGSEIDKGGVSSTRQLGTCKCSCQSPFVQRKLERSVAGVYNCALPCNASYFTKEQKQFATTWVTLWSTLCFVSTFLTLATFFLNTARFGYPERPVIFLSGCYFLLSFGYILRLIVGEEAVICDKDGLITSETTGPALCTLVFLFTYFGGMASALWWVLLAFTWFLAAGMKWSNESISNVSQYFHIVAWLIPSVQTIAVLAMSSIDGDPLSGICYVGNQSKDSLVVFVIIPLGIYLALGTTFLIAGFVSLFRIRKAMREDGSSTNKLEKFMVRIGVFSVLYTVPATVTIGCYFYEMTNREAWEESIICREPPCSKESTKPDFSAFMVKYFMSLVVGVSTGFWICSMKTVESWRKILQRLFTFKLRRSQNAETVALRSTAKTTV
uniref:Frizzled 2 n=1 Tax=Corallium rubrum TaxID=142104 RepID=A0A0B5AI38_9CNID|nr:frizzled 2 [Corallium rubrum]